MTRAANVTLAILVAGAVILPWFTAHAIAPAISHGPEFGLPVALLDGPGCLLLILLGLLAARPLLGLTIGLDRYWAASRALGRFTAATDEGRVGGMVYRRLPGDGVAVFTAGLRRPVIYVSEGAERSLSRDALHAALLHEQAHHRSHDVRWKAIEAAVARAFHGVPWLRESLNALALHRECRADDRALKSGAPRRDLFDAIALAAAGDNGSTVNLAGAGAHHRLGRLAGDPSGGRSTPLRGLIVAAVYMLALPVAAHLLAILPVACGAGTPS